MNQSRLRARWKSFPSFVTFLRSTSVVWPSSQQINATLLSHHKRVRTFCGGEKISKNISNGKDNKNSTNFDLIKTPATALVCPSIKILRGRRRSVCRLQGGEGCARRGEEKKKI